MSSYKQLYTHLANADGTFNLLELQVIASALSFYTEHLKKIDASDDIQITAEIQTSEDALRKIKKLYKAAHGPKI